MNRKKNIYVALLAVLLSPIVANADIIHSEEFSSDDGGYSVSNDLLELGWTWDGTTWFVNGAPDDGKAGKHSRLTSPDIVLSATGAVTLSFSHRYSIEPSWDGGAVFVSVNGGTYNQLQNSGFTQNGYTFSSLIGAHALHGHAAFNGNSAGYADNAFITSIAELGAFSAGDTISLQFFMAFDQYVIGTNPNWQLDWVQVSEVAAVPEPGTLALLGLGLVGMAARRRKTV